MNNKLNPVGCMNASIGALPTSYLASLSYEQQQEKLNQTPALRQAVTNL